MTQSSFYADGETYDTAVVTSNDVPASTETTQAPSGFYPDGTVYSAIVDQDVLLAELNAIKADAVAQTAAIEATASADAAASAASATAAATSASDAATSATNAATSASAAATSATNAAAAVQAAAGTATPLIDGTAAVGTGTKWAREDHKHPTDTTRAPLASPALTGSPTAPTPVANDNSTLLATTAWVTGQAASNVPLMDGPTALKGTSVRWARQDHVHPTDTTLAPLASPALTGTPTAPTATVGTNTTQLATTAFVLANAGSSGYIPKVADVGGRLTALSATPNPSVDVVSSQNLYLAPFGGKMFPLYSSAAWALHQFTSSSTDQVGLTLALAGSASWPAGSVHDVFGVLDAGTMKIGTRAWDAGMLWTETLITPSTTLASGGAAGYITTGTTTTTWSAPQTAFDGTTNKAAASSAANLQTTNTFAGANAICTFLGQDWGTGVTNVVSKVVVTAPNDGSFCGAANSAYTFQIEGSNDGTNWHRLSITRFNDTAGLGGVFTCPISVTELLPYRMIKVGFDSNGSNNVRAAQIQFYKRVPPANGRRLTFLDGMRVNDASMTVRTGASTTITTAQYEGFFLGTIKIDDGANGSITQHCLGGPNRVYGICNAYNKVPIKLDAFSYAPVTAYAPVTSQRWNQIESAVTGGGGITIQMVDCLSDNPVKLEIKRNVYLNCITAVASYESGIAVDTTLNFSGMEATCNTDSTGQAIGYLPTGVCIPPPVAGVRNFYGIERQGNNGAGPQSVSTGARNSAFTAEFWA